MAVKPEPLARRDGWGVYLVEDVDGLWRRYRKVVCENADMARALDRRRRDAAYEEGDLDWMGD